MTFYIRIQFPEGIVTWQLESKDQATALEAAKELSQPDGKIVSWSLYKLPQWS